MSNRDETGSPVALQRGGSHIQIHSENLIKIFTKIAELAS